MSINLQTVFYVLGSIAFLLYALTALGADVSIF